METFSSLEKQWSEGPALPTDAGTVRLLVVRLGDGEHRVEDRVQATRAGGIEGDRWSRGEQPDLDSQITLMMARVAELITPEPPGGQPLHLPGDNLLVDLDLSEHNLPPGSRLRVGTAVLEVTPKIHAGCKKFSERFGQDALRWVNLKGHRARRLRGLHSKLLEDGEISAGDSIEVIRRGPR